MNLRHEEQGDAPTGKKCVECSASLLCFARWGIQVSHCSHCRRPIRVYYRKGGGGWIELKTGFPEEVAQGIVHCGQFASRSAGPEGQWVQNACTTFSSGTTCTRCLDGRQ
jgi:hypothetical protein